MLFEAVTNENKFCSTADENDKLDLKKNHILCSGSFFLTIKSAQSFISTIRRSRSKCLLTRQKNWCLCLHFEGCLGLGESSSLKTLLVNHFVVIYFF